LNPCRPNERCTAIVSQDNIVLNSVFFSVETHYDSLTIDGTAYTGTTGPNNLHVREHATIAWSSDYSVSSTGWEICAAQSAVCHASCNFDGSVNMPAVQWAELLIDYGQPGNYKPEAQFMHNSCCGEEGGFCGTSGAFQDNQCRNALSVLVNELGYTGPALTCKFYSCTGPNHQTLPIYSRLAYANISTCQASSASLATSICNPPLRTTASANNGFLCSAQDTCKSVRNISGAGPMEGVSLGACEETCGASAGRYACVAGKGCELSTAGGSLYTCQQTCHQRLDNVSMV
jgi:hypothetical protein